MKILQVTPAYKPAFIYGGPTVSVALLCEQLALADIRVRVLTTTANGRTELDAAAGIEQIVDGVPVTYFKRITKDHTHFSPRLLANLWKSAKQYNVIHVHGWWNTVSMLSAFIAIARRVPLVVSPRGMLSSYTFGNRNNGKKYLLHRLMGESLLKASYIHTTARNETVDINQLVKTKGVIEIPNFVQLSGRQMQHEPTNRDTLEMVFFSRIEEKKGLDILFNALKRIKHTYRLTIAGDGESSYVDHLKSLADKNGIGDKLNWVGFQTQDKNSYLSRFDLMVLPSYDENFGNVVLESLQAGTPVLISENVGLSGYVSENNLGWVFQLDQEQLSETIDHIFKQKSELERIKAIAPARINEDFKADILLQRYISLYKLLTNG